MSTRFLDHIRRQTRERIKSIPKGSQPPKNNLDFLSIFNANQSPIIISEIKFASPSGGKIHPGPTDPVAIARQYLEAGASALSVLTEPNYFQGNIDYIRHIREAYPDAHILIKDFIISEAQIKQALEYGANAVLLIVALLNQQQLNHLYDDALHLGLTPIIEVHNAVELKCALQLRPRVIGINNRNLQTLEVNLDTARILINQIEPGCHVICESGINHAHELAAMTKLGFSGFLIGSHFMQSRAPGQALKQLISEIKHAH